jgi:two-component system NtrC family sensor kinase
MRRIAIRLMTSFLLIIVIVSMIFSVVGIRIIEQRVVAEAQSRVATDLNAAREIYLNYLSHVSDVIRFTAHRFYLRDGILSGDLERVADELTDLWARERLDVVSITDSRGIVLFRATNPYVAGDSQADDELVRAVLVGGGPVASTAIVSADALQKDCPHMAEQAYCELVETPGARPRAETEQTTGMMLKAAAPIVDYNGNVIGVLYGGLLLNRRYEIVDKIKETAFQGAKYEDRDIGTATIFNDDVRISTNVLDEDGTRAIGTRVTEEVYDRVVREGERWIGRAYVVNKWYISAYEPIRDINGRIIGILYVGILEEPYLALKRRTTLFFLGITLAGALLAIALSYLFSRKLLGPIRQLVSASWQVAHGNLDAKVEVQSDDELAELADAFNIMASALKARDEKLAEFTRKTIMESERLAVIGQLAADVAHELNNPLQGIVTYSHLLLERRSCDESMTGSIEKIVNQADRCRAIVRGLLDFSRPRKPQKKLSDVNSVLEECVSLVENQALFHNIEIVKSWNGNLPLVVVDPSQMQQVFVNMIINAAEAMDGSGRLAVTTRFDPEEHVVEVEFTDTGHGIDEENLERIFDPFFTTKEIGHGTGLGLAISYGIIREHKGSVSVESEVGHGTTFTIRLPVAADEGAEEGS